MQIFGINNFNNRVKNNSAPRKTVSFGAIIKNDIPKALNQVNKTNKDSFLCLFSGPSGVGKDTVLNAFNDKWNFFKKVVTCTTRAPRPGEVDGVNYHFLSLDEFQKGVKNGDFIEYVNVYSDTFYGTRQSDIDDVLKIGKRAMLIIDVDGAKKVKEKFSDALSVFIKPESIETLKERLMRRNTETPQKIQERVDKATYEIGQSDKYDAILQNDKLEDTINEMAQIFEIV